MLLLARHLQCWVLCLTPSPTFAIIRHEAIFLRSRSPITPHPLAACLSRPVAVPARRTDTGVWLAEQQRQHLPAAGCREALYQL